MALSVNVDAAVFFTWAAAALLLALASLRASVRRSDTVGFVLAPLLALALAYDNLALAAASAVPAGAAAALDVRGALALRGAVQSFVIPLFLVCLFELNYTVHKRRSSNFCGCLTFDQGRRRSTSAFSTLVRYSMWLLALAVLLVQVVLNAPYTADPAGAAPSARFTFKGAGDLASAAAAPGGLSWQQLCDVVPWLLLLSFCLYSGASLWRYGTTISTDVRTSAVNPWAGVLVSSCGLAVAWALSPSSWPLPYATNAMEVALAAALASTVGLVESNLRTLEAWERGLQAANISLAAAWARRDQAEAMLAAARSERRRGKKLGSAASADSEPLGWKPQRGSGRSIKAVALVPVAASGSLSSINVLADGSTASNRGEPV